MSEERPAEQSTTNRIQGRVENAVQAHHIGSVTIHAAPAMPAPSRVGHGLSVQSVVIAGVVVVLVVLGVVAFLPDTGGGQRSEASPATTPPTTTQLSSPPTGSSPVTPATPGGVPLSTLTPDEAAVLRDESIEVDQVRGTKAKVAHLTCADGTPDVLTETYRLGGAHKIFLARVSVNDKVPRDKEVTFTVLVDGKPPTPITVAAAHTESIEADLTGAQWMTLRTTPTTCVTLDAAWVEPVLVAP